MFTEQYKDTVLFSNLFKLHYTNEFLEIKGILDKNGVACRTLANTKDYWCRDYMPVQYGYEQYVQFVYTPDYLKDKPQYLTNPKDVMTVQFKGNALRHSKLIADVGNFTVCETKEQGYHEHKTMVVMTEKVFSENSNLSREEVIAELKELFHGQDFLFLPWEGKELDPCGHTDGLIHNLGKGKVLVNLEVYSEDVAEEIYKRLSEQFDVVELKLSSYDKNSWAYVNMLQTRDVIIVPGLGLSTDKEALEQIKALHPEYEDRVYQVNLASIINEWGGALNCLSWTMSQESSALHHSEEQDKKFTQLFSKAQAANSIWDVLTNEEAKFLVEYSPIKCEECKELADWYYGY